MNFPTPRHDNKKLLRMVSTRQTKSTGQYTQQHHADKDIESIFCRITSIYVDIFSCSPFSCLHSSLFQDLWRRKKKKKEIENVFLSSPFILQSSSHWKTRQERKLDIISWELEKNTNQGTLIFYAACSPHN